MKRHNLKKTISNHFVFQLKRAIVRSPITGKYETADYRISKRFLALFNIILLEINFDEIFVSKWLAI